MRQMEPSHDVESVVRSRLRSLRAARGWSLDDLAARSHLGASTLSRIENGKRSIDLDVLQSLCRAFQVEMSALLDSSSSADDVVIRPVAAPCDSGTIWPLTRADSPRDVVAAKWRLEPTDSTPEPQVHPGHDWFFVISGAIELTLGDRRIIVGRGEVAEFSTMTPHAMRAHLRPAEIITIFDRQGHAAHTHA